jgi:hypothetical protein
MKQIIYFLAMVVLSLVFTGCALRPSLVGNESVHGIMLGQDNEGSREGALGISDVGTKDGPMQDENRLDGYYFVYSGGYIALSDDIGRVISEIGEPYNIFESPSCAFLGVDKKLYYEGFIIDTYPFEGNDFVLSIMLTDSSVMTPEGIRLGASFDNMVAAYGNDYENMLDLFSYTKNGSKLSFLFENDEIVDITYYYLLAGN